MDYLKQMADVFILLIRTGAGYRLVYCCVMLASAEQEAGMYKKRIRNVIVFYVIAELIWQLRAIATQYFS